MDATTDEVLFKDEYTGVDGGQLEVLLRTIEGYRFPEGIVRINVKDGMEDIVLNGYPLSQEGLNKGTVAVLKKILDELEISYSSSDNKQQLINKILGIEEVEG